MRLPFIQALFCAIFVFSCVDGGIIGSDGRPGQLLGKGAKKRHRHDDLELNLNRQNLTSASNEIDEEEDSSQMLADMTIADAIAADGGNNEENEEKEIIGPVAGLQIDSFHIESHIISRFATTVVRSRVKNREIDAAEVNFSVVLPEEAFISNFTMIINNRTIVGDVKEKKAAKAAYDAARAAGQSAGHVEQSPRRTNAFKISVNVGGEEKVEFELTYQEVLTRTNDYYKHVINIRPGQIVKRMKLTLDVKEDAMIKKFRIPKIAPEIGDQTIHQLLKKDDWSSELEITKEFTKHASHLVVSYTPTDKQQREYSDKGINGQFVFLYDVERPAGGEIKAVNGYFVHFFAPEIADALPKHVIFVIDQSGSMMGTKIQQTKEAMNVILKDLSAADYFNILTFESEINYWKEDAQAVNPDSVAAAEFFVSRMTAVGGTNINGALLTALDMLNANNSKNFERYQSTIIFLTDGEATIGVTQPDLILSNIAEKQRMHNQVAIHSISFGSGADFGLLKKISARNGGLARKIYEDSDAAIQLHGFYSEISHPLLTNVKINYLNETVEPGSIVASDSKVYYKGGEVMTVGKLKDFYTEQPEANEERNNTTSMKVMAADIRGFGLDSEHEFRTECIIFPYPYPRTLPIGVHVQNNELLPADSIGGFVERMWAYKTIKQLLKDAESQEDSETKKKELKDKALALSLKGPPPPSFSADQSGNSATHYAGAQAAMSFDSEDDDVDSMAAADETLEAEEIASTNQPIVCQGANQITVDCDHPLVCNTATCESVGMTVDRNAVCQVSDECSKTHQKMCVCNFGYVMLNGECVEPRDCPQFNCSNNESLKTGCFADCEGVCGQPLPSYDQCKITCQPGKCVCQQGFVRNADGQCVLPAQCETIPKICTNPNAELNVCGQQCTQRTCQEVQELVSEQQASQNSTASISIPIECNPTCRGPPKCACRQGFFLLNEIDGQPTCVEIGQCPSYQCGPNEVLNPCGNACDRKCSLRGQPQPCSKVCELPACWCKPGYYRNDKDECVAEDDCDQKPTDEVEELFL